MQLRRALAVGCLAVALLGACGDDDDDATDDTTEDTTDVTDAPADGGGGDAVALEVEPLTGAAEVPGPGQEGASGTVERLEVTDTQVCGTFSVEGLDSPATMAHVHTGGPTESGPPIVNFGAPADADAGAWDTCVDADEATRTAITGSPGGHYVNVHTSTFPNGAVRGQISAG